MSRKEPQNPEQPPKLLDAEEVLGKLQALEVKAKNALRPVIANFQRLLDKLERTTFGSADENSKIARKIGEIASFLHQKFECQAEDPDTQDLCHHPARLCFYNASGMKMGAISFSHQRAANRTANHGAWPTFPRMKLVDTPPDGRRRSDTSRW